MMFQGFKETVLKKKLNQLLSLTDNGRTPSLEKIKSIAIISTEDISSEIDLQKEIEIILEARNIKIYSLRKFNKSDGFSYKHFTKKNVNWKGQFTEDSFKCFLEEPFDLLIGYFNKNNLYLERAILESKAQFKVGFAGVNSKLYEIEISEKIQNITGFTSELKRYLQILKKL
ncbi:hypothetical protein N9494_03555 [Polaribacter sp.]|nr:hypothetical protein [Polaribacter sp.]